jgi:trigger factor
MDVKLEKLPKSKIKLKISEKPESIKKYFDMAYKKLAPGVDIKGFRPGKAPRMMTIETIGRGKYNIEALNLALPEIYANAVKQEKIIPVGSPKINIVSFDEDKDLVFEAEVDLLPEIKLGKYKDIKVKYKKPKIEVAPEDVEKVIKRLQHQGASYAVKTDGAKVGDKMEISFTGKVKGVVKDEFTSKHYPFILGEKVLLPEFEKKLIGAKKGDKLNFSLDVKSRIEKKKEKVDFEVNIDEVWDVRLQPLDEEFVKKFGHKTISDLKKAIEKSIAQEKEQRERQIVEEMVINEILKNVTLEVPSSLVDQEVDRRVETIKKQTGLGFDKYLESMGKTIVELREGIRPNAEKGVRISLAIGEISKDMGYFDPKKLGRDMQKNHKYQQESMKRTMDKLIEIATK